MNELGAMLTDTVTRLLGAEVTKETLQAAEAGTWPAALWHALETNGLTRPLVPEADGGAGGTWGDAHVLLRAAGRHAAPVPLAETIVAGALLTRAGLPVPEGPLTVAPVRPGEELHLARRGGAWSLAGTATRVPWGNAAAHAAVVAQREGIPHLALVATGGVERVPGRNLALEPRDTLVLDRAQVVAAAPLADGGAVWRLGALVRAAQMAGALESLLEQSVRYANERVQFGRPVGRFQAVQQQLAVLAEHAAAAGIAAEVACRAAEHGDAAFEIAAAKVRAGDAVRAGTGIAHQVHGAIGFTYEHTLHFSTRRLWAWDAEFGTAAHWAAVLGRAVFARGADALWPDVTAR
jgi:acyl-CoA dehydrogenase